MKTLRIMKYVRKLLPLVVVVCLFLTYVINMNLKSSNTYVASEVIHYNDPATEQGLTPTGSKFDVNEIKSSAVMSKVVERMGLTGIYSVDSLISRLSITPLPDEDKLAQKEAKLEEGEEYVYEPSTFVVSFTATNNEGDVFARSILEETLDVYFAEYSQKYVNVAPANNIIENIQRENYDYIEMAELIDKGIDETLGTLYQRMEQNPYYRATSTGTSFSDLADDFNYLRTVRLSSLFSTIYKHQLTKSKSILVSDYAMRIDSNDIANTKEDSIVQATVAIMDAYVEKMRESGNTNITYEYILDSIHDRNLIDGSGNSIVVGDQTVTYDELIYGWRDHSEAKQHAIIDSAYCRYIIDTFSACTGHCNNGECQTSGMTCTQLYNADYDRLKAEVDAEFESLITDLGALYKTTVKTNEEYNQYLGASYISVLSSVSVKSSVNVTLYTLIAFFFLMILCCGGLLVLGRLGDIINYVFYTDHFTGLNNHSYFDKYLKSMEKKLLDSGTVCCMVDITNLVAINNKHSREKGDEVIKLFTAYLKEAFGKSDAEFIYNGKGRFVVMCRNSDLITVEEIMRFFSIRLNKRDEVKNVHIEYEIGIAETFNDNQTARGLVNKASEDRKCFITDAAE